MEFAILHAQSVLHSLQKEHANLVEIINVLFAHQLIQTIVINVDQAFYSTLVGNVYLVVNLEHINTTIQDVILAL
jgi:diacylglycerol kinase